MSVRIVLQTDRRNACIVIDTYAWIEYFRGSGSGTKAKKYIEGSYLLFTPTIVIAELSDKFRRDQSETWDVRRRFIRLKSTPCLLTDDVADTAGRLKHELRKRHPDASLADAIVLAHAEKEDAHIISGDKHLIGHTRAIDIR